MQDRPRKARGVGKGRIGVQRIVIAAQPVDQRHLRARAADRRSHPARGPGIGCGGGVSRGGPPKPPSPRQKMVCVTVADQLAARLVGYRPFRQE